MKSFLKKTLIDYGAFDITIGSVLTTIFILVFIYLLIQFISILIKKSLRRRNKLDARSLSLIQLIKYIVWTFGILFALHNGGVNVTFLIASSAALLVGLGLGLQNIFKDFMSGIIILIEGIVKVNDIVEVDGMVVKVKQISLRTSEVLTRDDKVLIVPNYKFIENNVVNWTHNYSPTRFSIQVGVDYSSDIRLVEKCIFACAMQHDQVIKNSSYTPFVRFTNFGTSSLDFELFFWSENLFKIENTKSDIRFAISDSFKKNNITVPFTQLVIHQAK
jgi:small-conductance mechanosensitive channel